MGFMGGSFNTREFFHGASARRACARSSMVFVVLAFVVPLVLLLAGRGAASAPLLLAAFVVQYVGLLAERWFFFAQAQPSAEPVLPGGVLRPATAVPHGDRAARGERRRAS